MAQQCTMMLLLRTVVLGIVTGQLFFTMEFTYNPIDRMRPGTHTSKH